MNAKEQLWYLINGLLNETYEVKTFCDEFTRIYDLETDYDQLSEWEYKEFGELSEMAGRFSNDIEDLKLHRVYFSAQEIVNKAEKIKEIRRIQ